MEDTIHFMTFAIFDASGICQTVFEHHVRIVLGIPDVTHMEEIMEDMLDAQDMDYTRMTPIYDKRSKLWVTHKLDDGCAGFFCGTNMT